MQAAVVSRLADPGGASGCANGQGSNFEGHPAVRSRRCGGGVVLLGDHGAMDVLSSRVLLRPTDLECSRAFYRDTLGLAIYREFGSGRERGTVFFLGGGSLELSGRATGPATHGMGSWLQVRELAVARRELGERSVRILREPKREPLGLHLRRDLPPARPGSRRWPGRVRRRR